MALQGTIQDFGLGDIFQLIGIQRKSGVLTLSNGGDTVTVKFLEGQVVGADTKQCSVEDLLGGVLVRTGRITEQQLQEALKIQRRTLQRLGHVLVKTGMISEDDLVEALRIQSLQIVYRLFRWRSGAYHFQAMDELEYDDRHFRPISAETILMEGARMIDEWPIIERRIKSDRMVLRRTPLADELAQGVEATTDRDIAAAGSAALGPEEREVLALVDGGRTVEEVNDRSSLGEFDTYRILSELITRKLVDEVPRAPAAVAPRAGPGWGERLLGVLLGAALAAGVGAAVIGLPSNPLAPWRFADPSGAVGDLRRYEALARLERIERALRVFYLDAGTFPDDLAVLASGRYLAAADLVDPWGRAFVYRLSPGGWTVQGADAEGRPSPGLTVSHRFGGIERALRSGAPEPGD